MSHFQLYHSLYTVNLDGIVTSQKSQFEIYQAEQLPISAGNI